MLASGPTNFNYISTIEKVVCTSQHLLLGFDKFNSNVSSNTIP